MPTSLVSDNYLKVFLGIIKSALVFLDFPVSLISVFQAVHLKY